METKSFIVIAGNISEGFLFYGPFDSFDDADEYCQKSLLGDVPTWIATLQK